jgi:hypothetical protein
MSTIAICITIIIISALAFGVLWCATIVGKQEDEATGRRDHANHR